MAFLINLSIIVGIAIIVVLIANHYFFKNNILYDRLINAKTPPPPSGGVVINSNVLSPTDADVVNSVTSTLGSSSRYSFNQAIGNSGTLISSDKFPNNNSNNFMMSIWFFIDDYNQHIDQYKFISNYVGTNGSSYSSSLDLFLTPLNNKLGIGINTGGGTGSTSRTNYNTYYVDNIPLQKWNCLTISVNDRTMDVYLDGKLVNSYILEGFYIPFHKSSLYLGNSDVNSFSGYITRVRYEPNSISPETAYNIYREGIDSSIMGDFLNKYRLKVGFYEYDRKMTEFTL